MPSTERALPKSLHTVSVLASLVTEELLSGTTASATEWIEVYLRVLGLDELPDTHGLIPRIHAEINRRMAAHRGEA